MWVFHSHLTLLLTVAFFIKFYPNLPAKESSGPNRFQSISSAIRSGHVSATATTTATILFTFQREPHVSPFSYPIFCYSALAHVPHFCLASLLPTRIPFYISKPYSASHPFQLSQSFSPSFSNHDSPNDASKTALHELSTALHAPRPKLSSSHDSQSPTSSSP